MMSSNRPRSMNLRSVFVISCLHLAWGYYYLLQTTPATPKTLQRHPKPLFMSGHAASVAATQVVRRAVGKLRPEATTLLLCDMQERFRPLIWKMETVVQTCQYLTSVASILEIPMVVTQQYTKVFGPTLKACFSSEAVEQSAPVFEKKKFSMCTEEVLAHLESFTPPRPAYLLLGIEAHVCVQQTCLDLLEMGAEVHVIVDGVSSQQALDRQVALQRMQQAGARLTTAQSVVFMLMQSADHPQFKPISKLTVEHMKLPNEFNQEILTTQL